MTALLAIATSKVNAALVAVASCLYGLVLQSQGWSPFLTPIISGFFGAITLLVPAYLLDRRARRREKQKEQQNVHRIESQSSDRVSELTVGERKELRELMARQFDQQREFYELRHKEDRAIIETYKALMELDLKGLREIISGLKPPPPNA